MKKPKTAAMANKSLVHEEKRLMSKTGGCETGSCDAHTEFLLRKTSVAIEMIVTSERMGLLTILIQCL